MPSRDAPGEERWDGEMEEVEGEDRGGSTREASHIPDLHELAPRRRGGPGAGPNSAAVSSGPARQYVVHTGSRWEGRATMIP